MTAIDILKRFEGLPFTLEVEVGNFEMSIRDILGLKEGDVLRTNHAAKNPLTLRAGGAPIALVELVAIEDALSARVANLLQKPAANATDPKAQSS